MGHQWRAGRTWQSHDLPSTLPPQVAALMSAETQLSQVPGESQLRHDRCGKKVDKTLKYSDKYAAYSPTIVRARHSTTAGCDGATRGRPVFSSIGSESGFSFRTPKSISKPPILGYSLAFHSQGAEIPFRYSGKPVNFSLPTIRQFRVRSRTSIKLYASHWLSLWNGTKSSPSPILIFQLLTSIKNTENGTLTSSSLFQGRARPDVSKTNFTEFRVRRPHVTKSVDKEIPESEIGRAHV